MRDWDRARGRQAWVLCVVGVAQLMVVLDATIVNIALPSAQHDLGFDDGGRQWVVTAYALAFGSLLLLAGRLSDLFGRRAVFLAGLAGFAAASLLGGSAPNFKVLVCARALQGVSGALLAPAALSILTTTFTGARERSRAFAIYGAIAGAGGAGGLLLGGVLTEYLTWRWCLFVNVFLAAFAAAGALVFLSGRPRGLWTAQRPRLDLPGTLAVSAALFFVVYGFSNADTAGWRSSSTWSPLAAGGVLLVAFVWWQTRSEHPLLPLRVLADRNRAASFLSFLITSGGMFGVFLFLTYYLQLSLNYSPVKTGLAFLPLVLVLMVTAQVAMIVLLPRTGPKPLVPTGMALSAAAMLWFGRLDATSTYAAHLLPPLLVMGLGLGLIFAPAMTMATQGVDPDDAGVASAMVNTTQQIGGSVSTALLNTLATSATAAYLVGRPNTAQVVVDAQMHGFAVAYWWAGGFFAAGAVVSVLLYPRRAASAETAGERDPESEPAFA
ncbi:MAG TPA: MFS transporter [Actinocrinis sp.]|nr:MFS transporter [Actinocrinis sp.]